MLPITEISSFMDEYLIANDKHIERYGILPVELVIETMREMHSMPHGREVRKIQSHGHVVDIHNTRLNTFIKHGTKCVSCGVQGAFFAVERNITDNVRDRNKNKNPVILLNLYSINEDGKEVLMNMDHRLPRAHGGSDSVENMQTMCQPCNLAKGCRLIHTDGGVSKEEINARVSPISLKKHLKEMEMEKRKNAAKQEQKRKHTEFVLRLAAINSEAREHNKAVAIK